jgi:glutathione synthase/RimK-type ligase-like ATP-grasp enzyme
VKKLLILSRFVHEYEPVRLKEEGVKAGFKVDIIKYGQISLGVPDVKSGQAYLAHPRGGFVDLGKGRKLSDYDLVVMRAASKKGSSMVSVKTVILSELRRLNKKVINGESFWNWPLIGKIEQGVQLANANLPTIPLIAFGSKKGWDNFKPNFPCMVKGRFGSHGRTVKLVETQEKLDKLIKLYKEGNVLVQPVIPVRQWYRCIVINGEYLGEMRHRQKSKYGGREERLIKFNSTKMANLKEICLKASKLFGCDYCGIDVGWDEQKKSWVIFEVNRTAQFKYFEKRTGVNVAGKLIQ